MFNTPTDAAAAPALAPSTQAATVSGTMEADSLPTSFGTFKPVGHVMMGLPTQAQVDALATALHTAGWPGTGVLHFTPKEEVQELQALVDNAGAMSGFGYEITLLRRYLELAKLGYRWLLVKVDDADHAAAASEMARTNGATLAVYYRLLVVEELI